MKLFKSKAGFTLIELLVVIGILAVLAAIAIPSVAGLIDRANKSADDTNANEMTNAIERFASEYELYCQDIASGVLDTSNLDSAQGRVYNVTKATTRGDIEILEIVQDETVDDDAIAIYRDTKYPANAKTMQLVVQNYTKTSSSTFEPKQSDMVYWYSPDCGVVVVAEPNKTAAELDGYVISGMDAKGNDISGTDRDAKWIDLTTKMMQVTTQLSKLTAKTWTGLTKFDGYYIWTDGKNTYYSYGSNQYMLNGDTWVEKIWNGYLTNFYGEYVWTDGTNTCYSKGNANCRILNGDTWEIKTRKGGLSTLWGDDIWTDGTNTYYSSGSTQYVLNSTGTRWSQKTWNGLTNFDALYVWTDGTNYYYSNGTNQYVFS